MHVAIVGFGSMGSAIFAGAVGAGTVSAMDVLVVEPDVSRRAGAVRLGAAESASGDAIGAWVAERPGAQVLLAVKPQCLAVAAEEIRRGGLAAGTVVTSILAGTPSGKVREALGGGVRVVRAMPNLPANIGQGCTAICLGAEAGDDAVAMELFHAIGPLTVRLDEDLMDAFTAVAGSGPAYLFYLAEAMERAATEQGFTADQAGVIVRQTLLGAAMLLAGRSESPQALRAAVTSRGGTTAAAVEVMEASGVMGAMSRAIRAARDRGREIAESA